MNNLKSKLGICGQFRPKVVDDTERIARMASRVLDLTFVIAIHVESIIAKPKFMKMLKQLRNKKRDTQSKN